MSSKKIHGITEGRYWLFGMEHYYPNGGMNDFKFAFNNAEEFQEYVKTEKGKLLDRHHILDTVSGNMINVNIECYDWGEDIVLSKTNGTTFTIDNALESLGV